MGSGRVAKGNPWHGRTRTGSERTARNEITSATTSLRTVIIVSRNGGAKVSISTSVQTRWLTQGRVTQAWNAVVLPRRRRSWGKEGQLG